MSNLLIHNPACKLQNIKSPCIDTIITCDDPTVTKQKDCRVVLLVIEPEIYLNITQFIKECADNFDYIITYYKDILDTCSNAFKYIYGTTFISESDYKQVKVEEKQPQITFLCSDKNGIPAHRFRHQIYEFQDQITVLPFILYRGIWTANLFEDTGNSPLLKDNNKFHALQYAQFHFAIENSRQIDYFTEKLCDCLITKTIPIYYGCPNIGDFFDTTGWIILDTLDFSDLLEKISVLDDRYYARYLDVVEKNYTKVFEYIDISKNISKAIDQIPDW